MTPLAPTREAFFTQRLIGQRRASPNTIASYRDTFRLLLTFADQRAGRPPSRLALEDFHAPLITAFLDDLEQQRGNTTRTRNARLAAVHSMFRFAALAHPEHAELIARALAIQPKRADQTIVTFLTDTEVDALLAAPDRSGWLGRRDHALLLLAIQTGLRVSELAGLRRADVILDPLHGGQLSRDAIERLVSKHTAVAARACPTRCSAPSTAASSAAMHRATGQQAHRGRSPRLSDPDDEKGLAARPAPHQRDAVAARRRRHHRDRALARPRVHAHHRHLPARRPDPQGESARADHPARHPRRPLPRARQPHRVPRRTVNIPTPTPPKPLNTTPATLGAA